MLEYRTPWIMVSEMLNAGESAMVITIKVVAPPPQWYLTKCFNFQSCEWLELELLLLIDQIR